MQWAGRMKLLGCTAAVLRNNTEKPVMKSQVPPLWGCVGFDLWCAGWAGTTTHSWTPIPTCLQPCPTVFPLVLSASMRRLHHSTVTPSLPQKNFLLHWTSSATLSLTNISPTTHSCLAGTYHDRAFDPISSLLVHEFLKRLIYFLWVDSITYVPHSFPLWAPPSNPHLTPGLHHTMVCVLGLCKDLVLCLISTLSTPHPTPPLPYLWSALLWPILHGIKVIWKAGLSNIGLKIRNN